MDCLIYVDASQRGEWVLDLAAQLPRAYASRMVLLATPEDEGLSPGLLTRAKARLAGTGRGTRRPRGAAGPDGSAGACPSTEAARPVAARGSAAETGAARATRDRTRMAVRNIGGRGLRGQYGAFSVNHAERLLTATPVSGPTPVFRPGTS